MINIPAPIIKFFGSFYLHKWPLWFIYKPAIHKVKGHEIRQIINTMETGDLLFTKHDGYLSSNMIPGNWSHVALVENKENIIHAVSSGVHRMDILDFCRVDHISLIRPNVTNKQINKAIATARDIVNDHVEYDFQFMDDNGKVYCSELVNLAYEGIYDVYYEQKFGRNALTPDALYAAKRNKKIIEFLH